jgi:hypothetical protein
MLLHARHQAMPGQRYRSGSGECAVQHLQQRTFTAAVIAQQANAVAFFSVKESESKSVPNAVSTRKDCAVSKVLIVAYPRVTGMFMPRQTSLTITQ